jgi:hypothetical protein
MAISTFSIICGLDLISMTPKILHALDHTLACGNTIEPDHEGLASVYLSDSSFIKLESNFEIHPEIKDGERFIYNWEVDKVKSLPRYRTLRIGQIAYDVDGIEVEGYVPIFVSKKELGKKKIRLR